LALRALIWLISASRVDYVDQLHQPNQPINQNQPDQPINRFALRPLMRASPVDLVD